MASIAILLCQSPKKSDQPQIPADLPPGRCKEPEPRLVDHAYPLSSVGNRAKAWEHSWKPWPLKTLQVGWQSGWMQSYVHKNGFPETRTDFSLKKITLYQYLPRKKHHLWSKDFETHPLDHWCHQWIPAIRFTNCDRIGSRWSLIPLPLSHEVIHVLLFVASNHQTDNCPQTLDWAKKFQNIFTVYR